jgi:hypothetical protein
MKQRPRSVVTTDERVPCSKMEYVYRIKLSMLIKKIFLPHRKHCGSITKTYFVVFVVLWKQKSKVWAQLLGYTDNAYELYSGRPRFKSWSKYQSSYGFSLFFLIPLREMQREHLKVGHGPFLPRSFQLLIH